MKASLSKLTSREKEVLALVSKGMKSNEIAENMEISVQTVHTHRKHIWKKLGIHSLAEFYLTAIRFGK